MMRKKLFLPMLVLLAGCQPNPPSFSAPEFRTVSAAQRHCPKDSVVWVDNMTGVYHMPADHWYGRIIPGKGGYVCLDDAAHCPKMHAGHNLKD